jgi:polyhydroxyalkanoate synthase
VPPGEVIWREGSTTLVDYLAFVPEDKRTDALPLLVVPSLVNRAYVLDLSAETSFLRWLAARGVRPVLVDWGQPGDAERTYGLEDYIAGRLARALAALTETTGAPLHALGYCMGGLLALGLALLHPEKLRSLILLATPWDFHAGDAVQAALLTAAFPALLPSMRLAGELPADAIQTLFTAQDPMLVLRKYLAFARLDPDSERARRFVALEDWLNDGVPLTNKVAQESILSWYGENLTGRGLWRLAGRKITPEALACPSLCVVPSKDRIVPPASAEALAAALPQGTLLRPPTGHIGMVASLQAPKQVWTPLLAWLESQA